MTKYVAAMPTSHSDINFIGVWAYDLDSEIEVAELDDHLVIKLVDYFTHEPVYSFLGDGDVNRTAALLLDHAQRATGERRLGLVHELCAHRLDRAQFAIAERPEQADYLYHTRALAELSGGDYYRLRVQIRHFLRDFPMLVTRAIDVTEPATRDAILALADHCDARKRARLGKQECDDAVQGMERARGALSKLLGADISARDFPSTGTFDDGRLVGYRIVEIMADGGAMTHFQAGDEHYPGVQRHLVQESSRALAALGVTVINEEQDLGLPGLRFFKQALRPFAMVRKYDVTDVPSRAGL